MGIEIRPKDALMLGWVIFLLVSIGLPLLALILGAMGMPTEKIEIFLLSSALTLLIILLFIMIAEGVWWTKTWSRI